jgi:hypothetical protein
MLLYEKGELLFLPGSTKSVGILKPHIMPQILGSTARKPGLLVVLVLKVKELAAQLKPATEKQSKNAVLLS